MKMYVHKLVDGTDDQYKVKVLNGEDRGNHLCGDQCDERFVKLYAVLEEVDRCEGDLDLLKWKLKKLEDYL